MSHSTTATSTYTLAKYSKSYPNGPQPNPESNTAEWQHFTNPLIRLVLDIKRGADLESVRLRILWSMDSSNTLDQREEDIDLLTLSCLPQRPAQKQAQGLPLKAVYRDTIVGIRYLHPIDITCAPIYRRFQITFLSPVSALEFIGAINTVCPCKANPSADPVPRTMNPPPVLINMASSQTQRQGAIAYTSTTVAPPASISTIAEQSRHDYQVPLSSSQYLASKSSMRPNTYSSSPLPVETNDFQVSSSSTSLPAFQKPGSNGFATHNVSGPTTHANQFPQHPIIPRIQELQQQTPLPSSSPPTSSAKSASSFHGLITPPSTAGGEVPPNVIPGLSADPASAILASLRESTSLYDLPRTTLEQLIGDVVREEGFPKLLEDISSMWGVKSYVGI
ncbi:hypothetical protein FPV67DRAFT_1561418 [Lyophyllum atratum]|nr:hypothetical protein FPV67DRAFT_1561418 [Lyophyllum atratum]